MPLNSILFESGNTPTHLYFPIDCIVSLLYVMKDGAVTEIAAVGNEGTVGVALFMGGETIASQAIVQSAGFAYRLSQRRLKEELSRHGSLLPVLLRYTQSLLRQVAQTSACNRHHSLEQRVCRRLLAALDRTPCNQLKMTQETVANMLGVRREGVTAVAGKLQRLGLIRYHRGQIRVLNRPGLEQLSCECFAPVSSESDQPRASLS